MRVLQALGILTLALVLPAVSFGQETSLLVVVERGKDSFRQGEYKKAAQYWEKATRLQAANPDYWDLLGRAYERQAEASSFPFRLTSKARASFLHALQLEPHHAGAMSDLIELETQPIGLCEGDLDGAASLVERLEDTNAEAAEHARAVLADAQRNASRLGQKSLCGPVKVSRVVTDLVARPKKIERQLTPSPGKTEVAEAPSPNSIQH